MLRHQLKLLGLELFGYAEKVVIYDILVMSRYFDQVEICL